MDVELNFEKRYRLVREVIETAVLTLLMFLVIHSAVQNFNVDGHSMEPNLHDKELILVDKWTYLFHAPARGDVIVFHYPLDTSRDFIKRVVGIPGDSIRTTSSDVFVDGQVLHEPYISQSFNFVSQTWKLGQNQFFVMGDNRDNSLDSRTWGPLDKSYIIGKAVAVYWPINQWEWINTYTSVYASIHT